MSNLFYRFNSNNIKLNVTKNNKLIGSLSSIIFNNTLFINKIFVNEEYRFKNYGTYLMNSTEIILRQCHSNVNNIKLVIKQYPNEYLTFFYKIGYKKYDVTFLDNGIKNNFQLIPMYKNIIKSLPKI